MGGGIQKRIYLVEHQSGLDANQKRQRIAQDTGGWIAQPDPEHWMQKSSMGGGQDEHHSASTSTSTRTNYGVWNETGFFKAHRLTA